VKYSLDGERKIIPCGDREISCFAGCEMKQIPHAPQAHFTRRRRISLPQAISLVPQERISLKKPLLTQGLFLWGE
jgi:hypothetical protein